MEKLNFYGIGPKVGRIAVPWLAATILISVIFKGAFAFIKDGNRFLVYAGLAILIIGLVLYFITVPMLLKGLKQNRLVTSGGFYFCCNPLYASIILFILPGIALIMNSWLVLTSSIVAFILYRIHIKNEYEEMERIFGDEYRRYRTITPEFFPFPFKKLFS